MTEKKKPPKGYSRTFFVVCMTEDIGYPRLRVTQKALATPRPTTTPEEPERPA